jgi:membrane protease subunit HflK
MFERILDLLMQAWTHLVPFCVIDVYEAGGVLRLGIYHRTLEPGFHWKLPIIERVVEVNTCVTTLRLPPQTLTTQDRTSVVVATIIKYEIKDIRPYITQIWDQNDVLADVSMGAVREVIGGQAYDDLLASPPEEQAMQKIRREVNQYGFKVHKVTFTDLAAVRSFRLIQPHARDLSN